MSKRRASFHAVFTVFHGFSRTFYGVEIQPLDTVLVKRAPGSAGVFQGTRVQALEGCRSLRLRLFG